MDHSGSRRGCEKWIIWVNVKAKPSQQDLLRDQMGIIKRKKRAGVKDVSETSDTNSWKNRIAYHCIRSRTIQKPGSVNP